MHFMDSAATNYSRRFCRAVVGGKSDRLRRNLPAKMSASKTNRATGDSCFGMDGYGIRIGAGKVNRGQ